MDTATATRPAQKTDHSLILASRVMGKDVFNRKGEHLGYVDDLSIGKVSGKAIYAIMSFGGFLNLGEKFHPVPWSLLDYDRERDAFVVPLDKAALEAAPHYGVDELAELGGPDHLSFGEKIFGYYGPYGSVPYW
jgi:sporulation protein YlmC with PRC-barrel domain